LSLELRVDVSSVLSPASHIIYTPDIMVIHYLQYAALLVASTTFTTAQTSQRPTIIPTDLQAGFLANGDTVQVSFINKAINGFQDGTVFSKDGLHNPLHSPRPPSNRFKDAKDEPTFALGDSSGISPSTLYTIIMVDTTCPSTRVLHYARANFKNNFDITNINTSSAALQSYLAPGSLDEKGDNRQYTFLMYTNPGRDFISSLKLPNEGGTFDVQQFQDDNGLGDAEAGVGMVVKLGGEADCGSDAAESLPASLPAPRPSSNTAALSGAPASSIGRSNVTTTTDTAGPSSTADGSEGSDADSPVTASTSRKPASTLTSFVLESGTPGPSSVASTIVLGGGEGTATGTQSAGLAEQTASAAAVVAGHRSWVVAPLLVAAGVFFW
jgi:hypothetical protein